MILTLTIPDNLPFSALNLGRDGLGGTTFETAPLIQIAEANGLDQSLLGIEDNVADIIIAWYQAARASGEPADPVAEELITEARSELN